MMKKNATLVLTILFSLSLLTSIASAALVVKPAKQGIVRLQLYPFTPAVLTKSFSLNNTYDYDVNISLKVTDNFADIMKLSETDFVLKPGEVREIDYTVTVKEPGTYEGGIIVNAGRIAFQSDLVILAFKTDIIPELFLGIIILAILVPIAMFFVLKKKRSRK